MCGASSGRRRRPAWDRSLRHPERGVAGTVFNVEPILEIPDLKIHIRLDDTIVVTDTGADNLTAGVPGESSRCTR